jgi:hypothetical protein
MAAAARPAAPGSAGACGATREVRRRWWCAQLGPQTTAAAGAWPVATAGAWLGRGKEREGERVRERQRGAAWFLL